ncbi:hypothetical protein FO519_003809 [Halicephalobus sp. NKZ332]|nr:hypothetical protein FO519_003809 [Halicephalobus sp. NKZ332]
MTKVQNKKSRMFSKTFLLICLVSEIFGEEPKCDDTQVSSMRKCWMDYLGHFGYSKVPKFSDYLSRYVEYLNTQGPKGMSFCCSWTMRKEFCESPFKADCGSFESYMKILGVDEVDAERYFATEAVEVWECGDGYNLTMDHFECKLSVHNQHQDELNFCENKLVDEFSRGFNCSYAAEFVSCNQDIYSKYCGTSSVKFVCKCAEIALNATIPECRGSLPPCGI